MSSGTARQRNSASRRGVKVTVEHINANDLPARATAAIEGGTGPDILQLLSNYPLLYSGGLDDHNDLIAELGGDEIYPFIREAVRDEDGVHRGVPNFFGGGANVYRKDIFEEVGIAAPPETWDEYLEAGKKLKHYGMPVGQSLGHTFGDAPGFAYTLLWCFGGKEVDEDGKVALNSQETANAVDFLKEFWLAACDESGLAWDDTSNNRAFLAETIAVTLNGASIYFVARNDPPQSRARLGRPAWALPDSRRPARDAYHGVGPFTNCITRYSANKEAARDYIRFVHQDDNFEKFLVINKGYVNGPLPKWQEHPMWGRRPGRHHLPRAAAVRSQPRLRRAVQTASPRRRLPSTSSSTCSPRRCGATRPRASLSRPKGN